MADEQLRLTASVKDDFTAPLRNFKAQMAGIKSPPAIREMSSNLKDWQQQMRSARTELQTALSPALSSFGIATMGVGAGFAAIGAGVRNFAGSIQSIRLMGQEVGLTTNSLRAFSALGARFGISADTMRSGIRSFAGTMEDLRKRWGEAYGGLRAMNLGTLAEDLVKAPDMKSAIERVFNELGGIPDPVKRQRVLRMLGLPEEWSVIASELKGRVKETVDAIAADQGTISAATEAAANKFETNVARFQTSLDNLRVQGFSPLLPVAAEFVNTMTKAVSSPQFINDLNTTLKTTQDEFAAIKRGWEWMTKKGEVTPLTNDDEIKKREIQLGRLQKQLDPEGGRPWANQYPEVQRDLKKEIERLTGEIKRLREEGATAQKSAFGGVGFGAGGGGLIQNASFGVGAMPGFRFGNGPGFNPAGGPRPGVGGRFGAGADAPRGNGVGTPGAASQGEMMRYAMDQLRREGVPEANLRAAAAHLVGQAASESGLNPNLPHDHGTGYGIYGARDPNGAGPRRRTMMLDWLAKNGYARNSAEGQMRYMSHEAMTRFPRTRRLLMGANEETMGSDTHAITQDFESPAVINDRRSAVTRAYRGGPDREPETAGAFPAVRTRADWSKASGAAGVPFPQGWTAGADRAGLGDEMMKHAFAPGGIGGPAPKMEANGSVSVHLTGGLEKLPARVTMDGLFKDVQVSRATQVDAT